MLSQEEYDNRMREIQKAKNKKNRNMFRAALGFVVFILIIANIKDVNDPNPETERIDFATQLKFEIITFERDFETAYSVEVKVTNISGRPIKQARITCIILNKSGKDVGFEYQYLVKLDEKELKNGDSQYLVYPIDVQSDDGVKADFQIESIRF